MEQLVDEFVKPLKEELKEKLQSKFPKAEIKILKFGKSYKFIRVKVKFGDVHIYLDQCIPEIWLTVNYGPIMAFERRRIITLIYRHLLGEVGAPPNSHRND